MARYVLAVEYTRAALSVWLLEEDCYYEEWGSFHSFDVGRDSMESCFVEGRYDCEVSLENALKNATTLPFRERCPFGPEMPCDFVPDNIDAVVIFGEAGRDARLASVLRSVLKGQFNDTMTTKAVGSGDLAFAAAHGAAKRNLAMVEASREEEL